MHAKALCVRLEMHSLVFTAQRRLARLLNRYKLNQGFFSGQNYVTEKNKVNMLIFYENGILFSKN